MVTFGSINDRDTFRSYGPKLKPYDRHQAGIRLALPDFLVPTFKLLEHEGFQIVRRRPGTRRSIKFNDLNQSLVMDVKLPGSSWVRITPDQVQAVSRMRRTSRVPAVSEILDIAGQELPPETNVHGNGGGAGVGGLGDPDEDMEDKDDGEGGQQQE